MTQFQTSITKGFNGLRALTAIDLNENYSIEFVTRKQSNKTAVTSATIYKIEKQGNTLMKNHIIYQDYSKILVNHGVLRLTEKTITKIHEEALNSYYNKVLADVKQQYKDLQSI